MLRHDKHSRGAWARLEIVNEKRLIRQMETYHLQYFISFSSRPLILVLLLLVSWLLFFLLCSFALYITYERHAKAVVALFVSCPINTLGIEMDSVCYVWCGFIRFSFGFFNSPLSSRAVVVVVVVVFVLLFICPVQKEKLDDEGSCARKQ